jgi:hypothetical protein
MAIWQLSAKLRTSWLDGKPVQMLDRREVPVTEMTDAELFAIAAGGLPERKEHCNVLLLPPGPKSTR